MNTFSFVDAESLAQAVTVLGENGNSLKIIAGGTDIMSEIKEGTISPTTLVSLGGGVGLNDVVVSQDGIRIGALVTVSELEAHAAIVQAYPALAQAASSVATPQIRNVGTVGGNLCQRPRCWFYRSPLFDCSKKGGTECFASGDSNKYHAIFGGSVCHIVHPSDLAVALISLQAMATIQGADGSRTIALEKFFVTPDVDIASETVLKAGEILTDVTLPPASPNHRSVYLKAKERSAMDFALSSVAIAWEVSDGVIQEPRVTLGGVAPIPWRVPHVEDALTGKAIGEIDPVEIGRLAARDARPLKDNGYKVRLTQGLVSKAVRNLISQFTGH